MLSVVYDFSVTQGVRVYLIFMILYCTMISDVIQTV